MFSLYRVGGYSTRSRKKRLGRGEAGFGYDHDSGYGDDLRELPSVQEALTELDGVRGSKADHKEGTVQVTYEADGVTDEQFREAIAEAGYTFRS